MRSTMDVKTGNGLVVQVEAVKKPENSNKLEELAAVRIQRVLRGCRVRRRWLDDEWQKLQKEVEQFYEVKDPIAIENKIKTVRYLCELCKFKVCPPGVILDMLNKFCDDLSHHHAELCANILPAPTSRAGTCP